MNIQALIQTQPDAIQTLFDAYGINKPVNVDTVSAAIVLYKTPEGNTFLEDLAALAANNENNYEDFTFRRSQEKKDAAATRRAEQGGSKVGLMIKKVIPLGKKVPNQGITTGTTQPAPLTSTAQAAATKEPVPGGDITPKQPGSKVSEAFEAAANVASSVADAYNTIKNGKEQNDTAPSNDDDKKIDWKKYMPYIIGGATLVVVGIIIYLVTRKK